MDDSHGQTGAAHHRPGLFARFADLRALAPWALILLLGAGAATGAIYAFTTSDNIVPVFISLWRWTPFYWECDRFGSFTPLLALPFSSPAANLAVQNGVCFTLLFIAVYGLLRTLRCRSRLSLLLTLAALPAFFSVRQFYVAFGNGQSFVQSLGVLFLGMLSADALLRRKRPLMAYCCLFLGQMTAVWICEGVVVSASVLFLALHALLGRKNALPRLALLCVAFGVVHVGLRRVSPHFGSYDYGLLPANQWLEGVSQLINNAVVYFLPAPHQKILFGLLVAVTVWRARASKKTLAVFLSCLAILAAEILVVGSNAWVKLNDYNGRYIMIGFVFVFSIMTYTTASFFGNRRGLTAGFALVLVLLAGKYEPFSFTQIRRDLLGNAPMAAELLPLDCRVVSGGYWQTWPLALSAEIYRQALDQRNVTHVVSVRSADIDMLAARDMARCGGVAVLKNDLGPFERFLANHGATAAVAHSTENFFVFVVDGADFSNQPCSVDHYLNTVRRRQTPAP